MAVITTGAHPAALWPGVESWFGLKYGEHPQEWSRAFTVKTSNKKYEEQIEGTGFGLMPVKTEGGAIEYDSDQQGITQRYTHVAYAMGYIVTKEELDDNLYTEVSMARAERLAFSKNQTKEIVCWNVYNRAFSGSYTFGDGVSLINASHPTIGGNQSNILSPAADLSEAALEDLDIQIAAAVNSRNLQIALTGRQLIIPTALKFEAARILKSVQQSGTANNDINALRSMGTYADPIVSHYLSDTDAWFVRTMVPGAGMTVFNRTEEGLSQDNDFDTYNAKAKTYMRFSVGCGDFRDIYGSAGA